MLDILYEIKSSNMSEENHKKLFSSSEYQSFLSNKVAAICKEWQQYRSEIAVKYETSEETAMTDNFLILLNAGCSFFLSDTLKKCFLLQNGAVFHELGHRLFTMFGGTDNFIAALRSGNFYPAKPILEPEYEDNVEKLQNYIKDEKQANLLAALILPLTNDIEDGRIENILLSFLVKYTNMHMGLNLLRKKVYDESPSYEEIRGMVESGEMKPFTAMEQLILYYGRFGEIKGYDHGLHRKDELIQKFNLIQDDLDQCLDAAEEIPYFKSLTNILCYLIDDIIDYISAKKEEIEQQLQQSASQQSSASQSGSGGKQGTKKPNAGSAAQSSQQGSTPPSPLTQQIMEQILSGMEKDRGKLSATTQAPKGRGNNKDAASRASAMKNSSPKDDSDANRPEYIRNNSITAVFGTGSIEEVEDFVEKAPLTDLSWLAKVITQKESDDNLERQIAKDLQLFSGKIDFPSIHKGVSARFIRHKVTAENVRDYKAICKEAEKLASDMAKKSDNFQDTSMELPVLRYSGKRFCASEVYKQNYKYFEKNLIPEESPKLVIALVIDESGSMNGKKIRYARQLALVTYLYCRKIDAKMLLIGHSTFGNDDGGFSAGKGRVSIMCYSDFNKVDENDKYRIMNIRARGCNRDGYALRYAKEKLAAEPGDRKLLMIVSDGSPNDQDYRGTVAAKDLSEIVKECEKEDIGILAAAIDSDKDTIRGIYGKDHFLDITNLEKLPFLLTQKIKMLYQ